MIKFLTSLHLDPCQLNCARLKVTLDLGPRSEGERSPCDPKLNASKAETLEMKVLFTKPLEMFSEPCAISGASEFRLGCSWGSIVASAQTEPVS